MRKLYYFSLVLAFTACTNTIEEDTLASPSQVAAVSDNHNVRYADVLKLAQCQKTTTRSAGDPVEVECFTGKDKDTLLFVCKEPKGGWTIYSSDTRVPAIVAQSNEGSFEELMKIDGARLWIEAMAEDMAVIKRCSDKELKFTKQEIENNKNFWKSITSFDALLRERQTRGDFDDDLLPRYPGHYELMFSESHNETYDSIPSLLNTHWRQGEPYNHYCPLKTNNLEHAPAGCVAIAGAQMLYYLHNHISMPTVAPSQAYCLGNVSDYTFDQFNYNSTVWDIMPKETYSFDSLAAAPLIANVGKRLDMDYGNDGSGAYTEDLVEEVFRPYGIRCAYVDYNDPFNRGLLCMSLLNNMPVILDARTLVPEGGKEGHAFIADRYKRSRTVTVNHYEWVYDDLPPLTLVRPVAPKTVTTYESPTISMIGMNWGWGSLYDVPSEWFGLMDDWIVTNAPQYNWNISRHIIFGFQSISN